MSSTIVWKCAVVGMLRYIIGDDLQPYNFSDDKLKNLIIYSGFILDKDISYGQNYTFDLTAMTITPDPVVNKDFAFINLTVLKSAVVLARNQLRTQSTQAIKWKDGQSSFDGTELYKSQVKVLESAEDEFDQAWAQYQFGDTAPGRVILGPFSSDKIAYGGNLGMFSAGTVFLERNNFNYSSQAY